MTAYGFTGPSRLTSEQHAFVRGEVARLTDGDWFGSGAQHGADSTASYAARILFPKAAHELFVPGLAPHSEGLVRDLLSGGATVHTGRTFQRPDGSLDRSRTYLARNDALVNALVVRRPAARLVAFVPTREQPSNPRAGGGTWATARRAVKHGVPVLLRPLDGS